jgi:hypothetical protein
MNRKAVAATAAFCLFLVLPALRATTLERMSIEKMSQASSAIARVRCVSNATVWQRGEIWTLTAFTVEQTWRGALDAQITVRSLGGNIGAITSTVSGVPQFRPGEEVVLFLEVNSYGDYFVLSWQQGTFRIRRDRRTSDETIVQDSTAYAVFDPRTRRMEASGTSRMPVAAFRARVDSALSSGGAR